MIRLNKTGEKSERRPLVGNQQENEVFLVLHKYTPAIMRRIEEKGFLDKRDDLFQEVVLAVLEAKEKQSIRNPKTFLFGVTRNIIAKACVKRKNRRSMVASLSGEEFDKCKEKLMDDTLIRSTIEEKQTFLIKEALGIINMHLPELQAKVLKGFYLQSKTHQELAIELGMTETYIRQLKSRGLKKVKLLLRPKC